MNDRYGIILLDGNEVVIRIYEKASSASWDLLRYQNYDLTPLTAKKTLNASEIVETIAQMSLSPYARHVLDWKICARNITEEIVREVSAATSIKAELLSLAREQELLSKGMLMEI